MKEKPMYILGVTPAEMAAIKAHPLMMRTEGEFGGPGDLGRGGIVTIFRETIGGGRAESVERFIEENEDGEIRFQVAPSPPPAPPETL